MASQDWLEKDFYKILGVDKQVTEKELTKKYHKLAHKYHPDSNQGDAAAEARFKEISEAYSVLSDPEQRAEYDQIRELGPAAFGGFGGGSGGPGGFGGAGGFQQGDFSGFEDIFGDMFGGGGARRNVRYETGGGFEDIFGGMGGFQSRPRGPQKGADLGATHTIDLRQAITGDTVTLAIPGDKTIKVKIPAGVTDGKKIRVRGKGQESPNGGPNGDLILTVLVRKHPVFERDGKNLRVKLPVTYLEATLGATVEVPTITGERVKLRVQPGTPSGRVLRVKGRGVNGSGTPGDLLVEVQVVVPQCLTDKQRKLFEQLQELETDNPRGDLYARV